MTGLRVVAGTDVGDEPAPDPWDDEVRGSERVLRGALRKGVRKAIVVGFDQSNKIYVGSNCPSAEETIGFLMRAVLFMQEHALVTSAAEANEDDGA